MNTHKSSKTIGQEKSDLNNTEFKVMCNFSFHAYDIPT